MLSSQLELRQWLVYAAYSPEDFASWLSSIESIIARKFQVKSLNNPKQAYDLWEQKTSPSSLCFPAEAQKLACSRSQ